LRNRIESETIGRGNPLASTTYCLMSSASNIPLAYMLLIDGAAYTRHGVTGSYFADAGLSLIASLMLGVLLIRHMRRGSPNPYGLAAADIDA
jgi:MFS transporter, PAT family, beta-lactamase induction signal transducer AmpG